MIRYREFLKDTEYFDVFSASLEKYKEGGLPIVLFALDKAYYSSLWADVRGQEGAAGVFRKKLRNIKEILAKRTQRPILKKIVGYEIDAVNIKTILRLKRDGATPEEIMYSMILPSYELSEKTLIWMAEAKNVQEAVSWDFSHNLWADFSKGPARV